MKICVFAYNFPHKKTVDGILRLYLENYKINLIIFMNKIDLQNPKKIIATTVKDISHPNPRILAKKFKIPYKIMQHDSKKCIRILKESKFDLGIILGARILVPEVINTFKIGILNLHPGILPENRGLDTCQYAVLNNWPQGATAHLIDRKMDKGKIILKKKINIYSEDNIKDFYSRIQNLELSLMIQSLRRIKINKEIGKYPKKQGEYHSHIKNEQEKIIIDNLEKYKNKFKKY
jgi:folate-dependent phosphoribosylglycinamide formyltransferase PurN